MGKLIVFDADETLWTSKGYASQLVDPIELIDNLTVKDTKNLILKLFSEVPSMLEEIKKRAVKEEICISIASNNNINSVLKLLEIFKIEKYFIFPQADFFETTKSQKILKVLELLKKKKEILIDKVIFVDDWESNCVEVKKGLKNKVDDLVVLQKDQDIEKIDEVLKYI